MGEAARCPVCYWGRLTFPPEIEEQRCVGCMGRENRGRTVSPALVFKSEAATYRGEDEVYDYD